MTTNTETDLHARLAAVLERIEEQREPRTSFGYAPIWARKCLSDANAALALVQEHFLGFEVETRLSRVSDDWMAILSVTVADDGFSGSGATQQEALMAAYVAWAESEAGT